MGYLAPYFSSKTAMATSALARFGASRTSRRSANMFGCTDFGTLFSTLAILWTQQRWCLVEGSISSSAFQGCDNLGRDCQEFRVWAGIVGPKEIAHGPPQRTQHSDALLDQLLSGADPKTAFDPGGLLDGLKKALAERALNAEMDHHLAGENGAGNGRNGYGRKTVTTESGKFDLAVPRDRQAASIRSSSPNISGGFRASTRRSCRCTPGA